MLAAKIASFTDPKQKNAPMSIDSYQALYTGSTELTTKFIDLKIGFEQLKQKAINHQSELRDLQTSLQALMPVNAYAPIGCITNHYEQNLSQDINSFTQNIQTCQEHLNILKWYEFQLRQLQPASENRDAKTIEALIKLKISQNQARDKTTADVEASTNNNTSPN
ncbi:MAG: hypothetical protein HWD59_14435 [Coxiellaceae bacterium]|nr:MAG: hypothetical protein HWD59_14435 [Coxiellaceae bacterium]